MPAPVNPYDPVAVEQQLTDQLATINDTQTRAIVAAWTVAFGEVAADLEQTLRSVLTVGANRGRIPSSVLRRNRRLAQTLDSIAAKLEDLVSQTGIVVTPDLPNVVRRGVNSQTRLIDAQLEPGQVLVDYDRTRLPTDRQLDAIVHRTTQQVTSLLIPVAPDTEDVIRRELVRGVTVGSNPRVTARRMVDRAENRFNFGLTRATTIARTETLDAYRAGGQAGEQQHTRVLGGWLWLAHLGPRTCPSCLAKHGTIHDLDERGPDDHQQGRCARMPLVRRRDGSVDTSFVPDARRYFDQLPGADQLAIMGRRRLELLNSGAVDLADMTTKREAPGWRTSWVPTTVRDLQAKADQRRDAAA